MKTATFVTSKGTIVADLFDEETPNTVANFEKLANSGFYDGTHFHRVIDNFMIQGGDPLSKDPNHPRVGTGGPGYTIKCETHRNTHKHVAGTLSMAHAGKDTGGSQFFICHSPQAPRREAHRLRAGEGGHGRRDGDPEERQDRIGQGGLIPCTSTSPSSPTTPSEKRRIRPENGEVERLCGSNDKIRRITGWQPRTSLETGLAKTIRWFAGNGNGNGRKAHLYHI